jgi:Rha family phage regulatory protein
MIPEILVFEQSRQLWTTSLEVGRKFGKRHDTVLRAIRNLECSPEFHRRNFAEITYRDDRGREQPMFMLSRGGFAMVAMGFTGRDAVAWKEKFIAAFDLMERRIIELSRQAEKRAALDWQQARQEGKDSRRTLAAVLADFVSYARRQGSRFPDSYFINITRMVYRTFFSLSPEVERTLHHAIRDHLDARQLQDLATVEDRLALAIDDHMAQGQPYKTIFVEAKAFVSELARVFKPAPVLPPGMGAGLLLSGKPGRSGAAAQLSLWESRIGHA